MISVHYFDKCSFNIYVFSQVNISLAGYQLFICLQRSRLCISYHSSVMRGISFTSVVTWGQTYCTVVVNEGNTGPLTEALYDGHISFIMSWISSIAHVRCIIRLALNPRQGTCTYDLSMYLSTFLYIYLLIYLSNVCICVSIYPSITLSVHLLIYLYIYLPIHLSNYLYLYIYIFLSISI